jgi:quercetin dioxygenase-like cupin family protein
MRYDKYVFFHDREFPFFIDRYVIGRNECIPAHSHDFFEFVYVESGSAQHVLKGNKRTLRPGDMFMLSPGVDHSYMGSPDGETPVYNIMFLPELFQKDMASLQNNTYFTPFS